MGCVVAKHGDGIPFLPQSIPEVSVDVGSEVESLHTTTRHEDTKIVFVFGGPGSRKGRIVNDLVQGFGFYAISAESLILSHLSNEMLNNESEAASISSVDRTKCIQQKLKDQPSLLNLHWVLGLIKKELKSASENGYKCFLIDLVPNLRSMLQVCSSMKNCEHEMEEFENEWPYLFALDLSIKESKLVRNLSANNSNTMTVVSKNGLSDERDLAKTKRRYEEYSSSVRDFLQYFQNCHKLVTVDVSCGVADLIWSKVSEFFFNIGFERRMALNTVILFAPKSDDVSTVDLQKYRMQIIPVNTLTMSIDPTLESLVHALSEHIEKSHMKSESFILDMQGASLPEESQKQKQEGKHVMFIDKDDKQLHHYIYVGQEKCKANEASSPTLKAVCTTENEIFLFPEDAEIDLCKQVAIVYGDSKDVIRKIQKS